MGGRQIGLGQERDPVAVGRDRRLRRAGRLVVERRADARDLGVGGAEVVVIDVRVVGQIEARQVLRVGDERHAPAVIVDRCATRSAVADPARADTRELLGVVGQRAAVDVDGVVVVGARDQCRRRRERDELAVARDRRSRRVGVAGRRHGVERADDRRRAALADVDLPVRGTAAEVRREARERDHAPVVGDRRLVGVPVADDARRTGRAADEARRSVEDVAHVDLARPAGVGREQVGRPAGEGHELAVAADRRML